MVELPSHRARTKIVATVGPASNSAERLSELVDAGVDVFRLNMAHGNLDQHQQSIQRIRHVSAEHGRPIAILVDLAGPKIRLEQIWPDPLVCHQGSELLLTRHAVGVDSGGRDIPRLSTTYKTLVDELEVNDRVLLADGTVSLAVVSKSADVVLCRVTAGGTLRSRQGVNLPGVRLGIPSLTDADREHAKWAAQQQVDFLSLSFVRSADDIRQLKQLLSQSTCPPLVVAKIEKPEALDQLESIVQAADAVMVARGDLGVEIDVARMPVEQKRIVETCRQWARPVIVATQMLDSMQHSPRPTRAEVTDVANAILDGADACMLSAETAVGEYPRESVEMMNRIMLASEHLLRRGDHRQSRAAPVHVITSAVVNGAGEIAEQVGARLVVIATRSGATALAKSNRRDFIPTIAVSDNPVTLRRMCLYWGIDPVAGAPALTGEDLRQFVVQWGRQQGLLATGYRIVLVAGTGLERGIHNLVIVHEVEA